MGECARLTAERNALVAALHSKGFDAVHDAVQWLLSFDENAQKHATDVALCLKALDRPIRVACMVKNTGEP